MHGAGLHQLCTHVVAEMPDLLLAGSRGCARTGRCEPEALRVSAGTPYVHPPECQDERHGPGARRLPLVLHHLLAHGVQFGRELRDLGDDHRSQQFGLVGEVAVRGTRGDTQSACHFAQAEGLATAVIDARGGLANEGRPEVAVVVGGTAR